MIVDENGEELADATAATRREGHGSDRAAKPDQRLARGTLVGRYVVLDVIGAGGMGIVYAAYDPELDRKVAVKLLQGMSLRSSGTDQARLLREAQAMARLHHPNVLSVHDVGTLPGDRVFVAMELVAGITLRAWLRAAPRSWREVVVVMRQAGAGLAAAHTAGLVHRDFKLENVLVGDDGRVHVVDFGLARLRPDDGAAAAPRESDPAIAVKNLLGETLTIGGHRLCGTPGYLAPELYDGHAADPRTDQFAFGVAMYKALFRAPPYDPGVPPAKGNAPNPPAKVRVPLRVRRIVLRAIAVSRAERFTSMDELLAELANDPAAQRRRVALAAAVLASAGLLAGGSVLATRSHGRLCQGSERRLAGRWDAATREKIHAAFVATKRPFAEAAFASLARAFDAYAGEWTAAATDSCEATRVRGEQSEDVLELREACLDQRLDELGAVARVLASADGELVENSDKVVPGLDPIARCSNVAQLRATTRPPTEPRAKLEALSTLLAEAKAAVLTGRYQPALDAAKASADLASELHHEPHFAEALYVRGEALYETGKLEDAASAAADSCFAALRSRRDDLLAQSALTAALVAARGLAKPDQAAIWLGIATAAAQRLGHDRAIEHRRLEVEGVVAVARKDFRAALGAHEQLLAAGERLYGKDNPALWTDETALGETLSLDGQFARALPHLQRALALLERSMPDHPQSAAILTVLGAAYTEVGASAEARRAFERALAISERTFGNDSRKLVPTLNDLAEHLLRGGNAAAALPHLERARRIVVRGPGTSHPTYHVVETTYAEALFALGRVDEARTVFAEVLALEERAHSRILPWTQTSRAQMAIAEHDWKTAAELAERAVGAFEVASGKDGGELWQPLVALGRAKLGLGQPAAARPILERAIAIGTRVKATEHDLAPARAALAQIASSSHQFTP